MIRDVYLYEYKSMTFKERLYIVRNNDYQSWLHGYYIANPLDWSLRMMWSAWIKLVVAILWPVIYWPIMTFEARLLKTRYAANNDKSWFHPDRKTLK